MKINTFEELKLSGNLPSPAGVGMKILQLTRTEDYSADEMAEAIMTDPSLTGRILKLANVAATAGAEPATTVSESIMRLGGRTVRDLALAFSLVSQRGPGTCRAFDYEGYWSRSLARAVAAQTLSRVLGTLGRPEEAYICGLLAELGHLALASVYAETYSDMLTSNASKGPSALLEAESAAFNINHSEVAACMLEEWGLPESFVEAAETFTREREVPDDDEVITDLAAVLRYAHVVAEVCVAGEETSAWTWARLGDGLDRLREILGMDQSAFVHFCNTCANEWVAWGEALEVPTSGLKLKAVFETIAGAREAIASGSAEELVEPALNGRPPQGQDAVDRGLTEQDDERFKILAIDDSAVSLRVLTEYLEKSGYLVDVARGGKEGLKVALNGAPDIVIADLEMPDMDGLELCRSLRRTDAAAGMYFLLLTGREEEELIVDAFDAGVDDYITKPFIPRLLAARIKGGIRLARLQRKIEADKQTMMKQVAELGMLTRKLRATSLTDALTELPNRRYAMKRLESEWSSTMRTGRPLSVVMIDIDHFKCVNDEHGHDVGDAVLVETGQTIQASIRGSDEVCRIGGEEFLIICKNTSAEDCMIVAERVRKAVEEHHVEFSTFDRNVTVSLGVGGSERVDSITALIKAADEAVYASKDGGRNRVTGVADMDALRRSA